jgi:hypothetical protein
LKANRVFAGALLIIGGAGAFVYLVFGRCVLSLLPSPLCYPYYSNNMGFAFYVLVLPVAGVVLILWSTIGKKVQT